MKHSELAAFRAGDVVFTVGATIAPGLFVYWLYTEGGGKVGGQYVKTERPAIVETVSRCRVTVRAFSSGGHSRVTRVDPRNISVPTQGTTLYNCQTNHAEPLWSHFDAVEVGPCVTRDAQSDGAHVERILWSARATDADWKAGTGFYSVYGHYIETWSDDATTLVRCGVDALTDCNTPEEAYAIAHLFETKIAAAHSVPLATITAKRAL